MPSALGSAIISGMSRTLCWLAAALLALAAGCYRDSPPPGGPRATEPPRPTAREPEQPQRRTRPLYRPAPEQSLMAEALAKLNELTDEMCACSDQACANGVMQSINSWSAGVAQELKDQKPTDEETRETTAIVERLTKCMMATSGGPPGQPSPP